MTEARLHEALAAWNTGDAERVLAFWSDDWVFTRPSARRSWGGASSAGTAPRGHPALLRPLPGRRLRGHRGDGGGDRGAAEWTFRANDDEGAAFEVRGCDLFEFDGDLIRVKNAFRKVRESLE